MPAFVFSTAYPYWLKMHTLKGVFRKYSVRSCIYQDWNEQRMKF